MKTLQLLIFFILPVSLFGQNCNPTVPPATSIPGGSTYHVHNDSTINDQDGSLYYLCEGVSLTVDGSAGCTYYLEENCTLTINDHDGDMVVAKGNCTITDYSTESIVINKEASTTVSKPNAPSLAVIFSCTSVTYDYNQVGGSSPCGTTNSIQNHAAEVISVYPNPVINGGNLQFSEPIASFSIISVTGNLVYSANTAPSNSLRLPALTPGIYFAKIKSLDDNYGTIKLVIK